MDRYKLQNKIKKYKIILYNFIIE